MEYNLKKCHFGKSVPLPIYKLRWLAQAKTGPSRALFNFCHEAQWQQLPRAEEGSHGDIWFRVSFSIYPHDVCFI